MKKLVFFSNYISNIAITGNAGVHKYDKKKALETFFVKYGNDFISCYKNDSTLL